MSAFTIGHDCEYGIGGLKPVPACGIVGGEKGKPIWLTDSIGVHEDGTMLEINIKPVKTKEQWVIAVEDAIAVAEQWVMGKGGYKIIRGSTVAYDELDLKAAGPKAYITGCDPWNDAWTGYRANNVCYASTNNRYAAGHVHVGHHLPNRRSGERFVRLFDLTATLPSVLLDDDHARRKTYGLPGQYRRKPYGVELRSLSNFWSFNTTFIKWVYDAVDEALARWEDGDDPREDMKAIHHAVFTSDKALAEKLMKKHSVKI